jgi:hypothetical protein
MWKTILINILLRIIGKNNMFSLTYKCGHRNELSKRQVWMSIFHIIILKKKFMNTGVLDFFLLKTNPGLLFLL